MVARVSLFISLLTLVCLFGGGGLLSSGDGGDFGDDCFGEIPAPERDGGPRFSGYDNFPGGLDGHGVGLRWYNYVSLLPLAIDEWDHTRPMQQSKEDDFALAPIIDHGFGMHSLPANFMVYDATDGEEGALENNGVIARLPAAWDDGVVATIFWAELCRVVWVQWIRVCVGACFWSSSFSWAKISVTDEVLGFDYGSSSVFESSVRSGVGRVLQATGHGGTPTGDTIA